MHVRKRSNDGFKSQFRCYAGAHTGGNFFPRFWNRPSSQVAVDLIGYDFCVEGVGGAITLETEAYAPDDPASHSYVGGDQPQLGHVRTAPRLPPIARVSSTRPPTWPSNRSRYKPPIGITQSR